MGPITPAMFEALEEKRPIRSFRRPFPDVTCELQRMLVKCLRFVHYLRMTESGANPKPGQMLARGVCRHLLAHDFVSVEELIPARGLRVDVMALGPKSEVWVIECKSSRTDFMTDGKWQGYLEWCDRYFWAVDEDFPTDLLPEETGLIIADAYDAEIIRMGPRGKIGPCPAQSHDSEICTSRSTALACSKGPRIHRDGPLVPFIAVARARPAAARISSAISSASSGSKSIGISNPFPST